MAKVGGSGSAMEIRTDESLFRCVRALVGQNNNSKARIPTFVCFQLLCAWLRGTQGADEPPEGYYAFVESPNAEPPRVRPPPYSFTPVDCPEDASKSSQGSILNLCGDLNKGTIPRNPMRQNVLGSPYPL